MPSRHEYNELKRKILQILSTGESYEARRVIEQLHGSESHVSEKALRMALLRYHRQGLLTRERKAGSYSYSISERGRQRLEWLVKLAGRNER